MCWPSRKPQCCSLAGHSTPVPTTSSFQGLSAIQLALVSVKCSHVGVRWEMKKEKGSQRGMVEESRNRVSHLSQFCPRTPTRGKTKYTTENRGWCSKCGNYFHGPCKEEGVCTLYTSLSILSCISTDHL